jgi:hypothetical protein
MRPDIRRTGFVRAMVAAAEIVAAGPSAPASGRIVIEIGSIRPLKAAL